MNDGESKFTLLEWTVMVVLLACFIGVCILLQLDWSQ